MGPADPFGLERFVRAQEPILERALAELRAGRKTTHWMWFVFPQHVALGRSPMAVTYGVRSRDEARAYLAHRLLGPRLAEATRIVLDRGDRPLEAIFGPVDAMKFRSCMTLFAAAAGNEGDWPFRTALDRRCGGLADPRTLALLGEAG